MQKIVLLGPVYPYRGGISHYTGMLYRALSKKYDVTMISYKMQYPKILFKKEQKDFSNDSFKVENTNYLLHTANPFNWINSAFRIKRENPDLVIVQWWHPYFAPCYYALAKILRHCKILFVCHNVFPHERFPMDRLLSEMVLKQGNCFIVQSNTDAKDLQSIIENPIFEQTVHPTYNAFQFENMSKDNARKILHVDDKEKVLLFFGFIREYKGLKYLIEALPSIVKRVPDLKLFIVGEFGSNEDKEYYQKLIQEKQMQDNIEVFDGYIPDREVEKFFAACDLVVLPYTSATQSGIVQIAFGFEKPVVVTNVGGLPDVVTDGKTGYVVEAENVEQLADAVVKFYIENKSSEFQHYVHEEAYRFSWDRMVEVIERLMDW